jgi:hypothetical protein
MYHYYRVCFYSLSGCYYVRLVAHSFIHTLVQQSMARSSAFKVNQVIDQLMDRFICLRGKRSSVRRRQGSVMMDLVTKCFSICAPATWTLTKKAYFAAPDSSERTSTAIYGHCFG